MLKGTKTLLIGPPGSGKTTSLVTFCKAGLDLFCLITDPGGEESLIDAARLYDIPMSKLHWHTISIGVSDWDALDRLAQNLSTHSYEGLKKLKSPNLAHPDTYTHMRLLLQQLKNFEDENTGKEFGPVGAFGPDRALVFDSLSSLNTLIYQLHIGERPSSHEGEYGVVMDYERRFIESITGSLACFVVLTAHMERIYVSEAQAHLKLPLFLGKKLAPVLPYLFSDVIVAVKKGGKFSWSTAEADMDLKGRALPIQSGLTPSFEQVVDTWRTRNQAVGVPTND